MNADSDRDLALRLHKEMNELPKRGGRRRAEEPASEGSGGRQSIIANDSQGTVEPEYEVEKIVGRRRVHGSRSEFRVRWKGFHAAEDTWEPIEHLTSCRSLVQKYIERSNAQKSRKAHWHADEEPLVGAAGASRLLLDTPLDVATMVACGLDTPLDLRNLGIACRRYRLKTIRAGAPAVQGDAAAANPVTRPPQMISIISEAARRWIDARNPAVLRPPYYVHVYFWPKPEAYLGLMYDLQKREAEQARRKAMKQARRPTRRKQLSLMSARKCEYRSPRMSIGGPAPPILGPGRIMCTVG
jgi:hypothetical protein